LRKIAKIKVRGKVVKVLEGKDAEMVSKAIEYVLEAIESSKDIRVEVIEEPGRTKLRREVRDMETPKNFSYSQALLEALEKGLKNPLEIAEYIFRKRKKAGAK
jgi:hypothetical protein